jgi:hypothetical protein
MTTGWWRRNRWGLLLLVPALVLALYSPAKDAYDRYWEGQPHQPVSAAPGGWVSYGDARMRLVALAVDTSLKDFLGEPLDLADGAQAWRATVGFDTPDSKKLIGCQLYLEAGNGDTFAASPSELANYDLPLPGCAPDETLGASPSPSGAYQTTAYFVLPPNVRPTALRVVLSAKLPAYARLTPP